MVVVTAILGKFSKKASYSKKEKRIVLCIYTIVSVLVLGVVIIYYLVSTSGSRHLTKAVEDLTGAFGHFDEDVATARNIFEN